MKKLFGILVLGLALSSCSGNVYNRDPVGVGDDNAELKLSPCACIKVPQSSLSQLTV